MLLLLFEGGNITNTDKSLRISSKMSIFAFAKSFFAQNMI